MSETILDKKNPTQLAIACIGNAVVASNLEVSRSTVTTWDKQGYVPQLASRETISKLAKEVGLNVYVENLNKDYSSARKAT